MARLTIVLDINDVDKEVLIEQLKVRIVPMLFDNYKEGELYENDKKTGWWKMKFEKSYDEMLINK